MATTTTDDFHTVYDDEELCVGDYLQHATGTPGTFRYTPLVVRRTQYHPLSATINKRTSPEPTAGPSSMLLPCAAASEQDSAADG